MRKKVIESAKEILLSRLSFLEKTGERVSEDDPFLDQTRLSDNASPDSDAAEMIGHEQTELLNKEVEKEIAQIRHALVRLEKGNYGICEDCGKEINSARLRFDPAVTRCIGCETNK